MQLNISSILSSYNLGDWGLFLYLSGVRLVPALIAATIIYSLITRAIDFFSSNDVSRNLIYQISLFSITGVTIVIFFGATILKPVIPITNEDTMVFEDPTLETYSMFDINTLGCHNSKCRVYILSRSDSLQLITKYREEFQEQTIAIPHLFERAQVEIISCSPRHIRILENHIVLGEDVKSMGNSSFLLSENRLMQLFDYLCDAEYGLITQTSQATPNLSSSPTQPELIIDGAINTNFRPTPYKKLDLYLEKEVRGVVEKVLQEDTFFGFLKDLLSSFRNLYLYDIDR